MPRIKSEIRQESPIGDRFVILEMPVLEMLPQIGHSAFVVYAVLVKYSNSSNSSFPSYPTLARDTGYTRKTVIVAIQTLQEFGLLTVKPRFDKKTGRQTSNLYTLMCPHKALESLRNR